MKTKSKIITRENNIIDINEKPYKTKKEVEKVPEPTGFRIVLFPLLLQKKTKAGLHLTDEFTAIIFPLSHRYVLFPLLIR